MNTATPIIESVGGFAGPTRAFRIDPPLRDPSSGRIHDHVLVCYTGLGGPRIEVFGGSRFGTAVVMNPLPGSCILQHGVSIDDACVWALSTAGGYVIGEPEWDANVLPGVEPEPEPEPESEPEPALEPNPESGDENA